MLCFFIVFSEFLGFFFSFCEIFPTIFNFLNTVLRSKTNVENDPVLREADTESDCLADRAAALDEQRVRICPNNFAYIFCTI